MDYGFAQRVLQSKQPLIRVIDRYMHEDPENFISFAEGNPGFECMATDKIIEIAKQVMTEDTAEVLLYGENSGNFELKDAIRDRWKRVKGIDAPDDDILITTGGQQVLYLSPRLFVNTGDNVLMAEISYAGMIDSVKGFEGNPVGVKVDEDGINIEDLEKKLQTVPNVKYIYLIPTFNNPTGVTLPLEKRKAVYELACKYDKLIIEDDPYSDIRYTGDPVPPIKSLDTEDRVVYIGSFSKTIAAGLRVGFMMAPKAIYEKGVAAKGILDANTPMLNEKICLHFLRDLDFEEELKKLCAGYIPKWKATGDALKKYMPSNWKIAKADGGLFYYVRTPEGMDEAKMFELELQHNVGLVPSSAFSPDAAHPAGGFRLCFTPDTPERLEEGIKRFAAAAEEYNDKYGLK